MQINIGWTDEETRDQYEPRFLHALNALAECRLDIPVTIPVIFEKMALPATFDPKQFEWATPVRSDTILEMIIDSLERGNLIRRQGRVLFATRDGLEKRRATDDHWRRLSKEDYICDEDRPRTNPF